MGYMPHKRVFEPSEKEIENTILHWLAMNKYFAWKNQSTGIFDPVRKCYRRSRNPFHIRGVADILGLMPDGRLLAIEVKSKRGVVSLEQKEFVKRVAEAGGIALIARSLDDVINALREHRT